MPALPTTPRAPRDPRIAHLHRKYAEILRLRRAATSSPEHDPRLELAALAREFPGALREIDVLALGEIEARLVALQRVEQGGPILPWMTAVARFHELMRGALVTKRWLSQSRGRHGDRGRFEAEIVGLPFGAEALVWASSLARVARPPRGRLSHLVLEKLAEDLGLALSEAQALTLGRVAQVD